MGERCEHADLARSLSKNPRFLPHSPPFIAAADVTHPTPHELLGSTKCPHHHDSQRSTLVARFLKLVIARDVLGGDRKLVTRTPATLQLPHTNRSTLIQLPSLSPARPRVPDGPRRQYRGFVFWLVVAVPKTLRTPCTQKPRG